MSLEKKRKKEEESKVPDKDQLDQKPLNDGEDENQGNGAVIPNKGF